MLKGCQFFVKKIADEHVAGRMGNAEIGPGLHDNGLGRHAAGPEDRDLLLSDSDRIAEIGSSKISDPDL